MKKDSCPVLKGFLVGSQIIVWCPFCNQFHYHGSAAVPGLRTAHCESEDSAFRKTGYMVEYFTKKQLKELGLSQ